MLQERFPDTPEERLQIKENMSKARKEQPIIPPSSYQSPEIRAPTSLAQLGGQSVIDETVTVTEEGSIMTQRNDMSMPILVKKRTRKVKREVPVNQLSYEIDSINNPQFPSIGDLVKNIHKHPPFEEFFIPLAKKEAKNKGQKNYSYWRGIFSKASDDVFCIPLIERARQLKTKLQK